MKPFQASVDNPRLRVAALAMNRNEIAKAEQILKAHLHEAPTDVPAIRMLAEVAMRIGRDEDARNLLERALDLAPGFHPARFQLALLLQRRNEPMAALTEAERLAAAEPRNPSYRNLVAVILGRLGEYDRSIKIYSDLVREYPTNAKVWHSYGHVLKTAGRQDESIAAYRRAITRDPSFGEAYWSLANLKTFRFTETDIAAMRAGIDDVATEDSNRVQLHFALGKAYEDTGQYAASFEHYGKGNALHRERQHYNADSNTRRIQRLKSIFTPGFFAARSGGGCPDPSPIFIVGMPRSGSTLLEQILSSHSAVEGTSELPEMITMARELRDLADSEDVGAYAEVLAAMTPEALRELGQRYLDNTRVQRKTGRPFFIDKMPNNFLHVAIIQLALPEAKIIDARRHPMACCFSNFKQHYARGQRFSYGLADVGRFYRDYVDLMAHFDRALPGRIHRVIYEKVVEDTESEVRRLLDYCGLPFEAGCLQFFDNERPVRTASSEQVRQPIYRDGLDQWRHYDEWLGPLRESLGPVLDTYPEVPHFD